MYNYMCSAHERERERERERGGVASLKLKHRTVYNTKNNNILLHVATRSILEKILQQQDEILKRIKVLEKREQERDQLEKPAEKITVPPSIRVSNTYLAVLTEINPPPQYYKVGFF